MTEVKLVEKKCHLHFRDSQVWADFLFQTSNNLSLVNRSTGPEKDLHVNEKECFVEKPHVLHVWAFDVGERAPSP